MYSLLVNHLSYKIKLLLKLWTELPGNFWWEVAAGIWCDSRVECLNLDTTITKGRGKKVKLLLYMHYLLV